MLPKAFYDKISELRKYTFYKTLLLCICYTIPAWDFTVMTPELKIIKNKSCNRFITKTLI